MHGGNLVYGLVCGLAIALLIAAFTDLRRRQIDNWLNLAVALGAPLFWWATGLSLWPGVAFQVGIAFLVFLALAAMFALRVMGGGDVKLLTALALWLPWQPYVKLLVLMSLLGGALTIILAAWHLMHRRTDKLKIPYGVAIATAGLWILGTTDWTALHSVVGSVG
ncbi:A24 family peptidase [Novosphingobium lentum]|uniref:A24 family peptidase n=1 Tax=Novosphingobium lentum TaxID=145287 RepID=UPI000833D83D|nr:prepilin peptidase [Novosphingobium lentum]